MGNCIYNPKLSMFLVLSRNYQLFWKLIWLSGSKLSEKVHKWHSNFSRPSVSWVIDETCKILLELTHLPQTAKSHWQYHEPRSGPLRDSLLSKGFSKNGLMMMAQSELNIVCIYISMSVTLYRSSLFEKGVSEGDVPPQKLWKLCNFQT